MNKLLTGLAVWTLFLFIMGILFPIPTLDSTGPVDKVLKSCTIYGFFSLPPIVFYGSFVSLTSDWIAKRCKKYCQSISFFLHLVGASVVYIVTTNIDILIMAMLAAIMFFVTDRCFKVLSRSPRHMQLVKNLTIFLGFVGVTTMVLGSSIG